MSKIVIKNCVSSHNGSDGVRISGDVDVEIDGLHTIGNFGQGLNIEKPISFLQKIGLPEDTDPQLVIEVLNKLSGSPPDKAQEIVSRSRLGQSLRKFGVDLTTVSANLVTIASSPTVQNVIQLLS